MLAKNLLSVLLSTVLLLLFSTTANPITSSSGCQCAIRKVIQESGLMKCPRICTGFIFEPVCGFNPCLEEHPNQMFRTFPNTCELEATICDGPGKLYYNLYKGRCVMDFQDETSCLINPDCP